MKVIAVDFVLKPSLFIGVLYFIIAFFLILFELVHLNSPYKAIRVLTSCIEHLICYGFLIKSLSNSVHEFEIVLLTCFISVHCATLITYLSEELLVRYKFFFMLP